MLRISPLPIAASTRDCGLAARGSALGRGETSAARTAEEAAAGRGISLRAGDEGALWLCATALYRCAAARRGRCTGDGLPGERTRRP